MTAKDREDLLWSLASQVQKGEESPRLTDQTLERYREGSLEPEEEKQVELELATDRQARERLAKIAGVQLPTPPLELRERILERRPKGAGSSARPAWQRWWPGYAAAAALLLLLLPLARPPGLPADLAFELYSQGLSSSRSEGASTSSSSPVLRAFPNTRVQLRLEPLGEARSGLEFQVYRREGNRLQRLIPEPPLRWEVSRGAALLEGPAAALTGPSTGSVDFFFVVHRPGDSPAKAVELADNDPVSLLANGQRRKVYAWQIQLSPAPSDDQSLEEHP